MTNLEQNPCIQCPEVKINQFIGILTDKIDLVPILFAWNINLDSGISKICSRAFERTV